jgi:hypothetical protein
METTVRNVNSIKEKIASILNSGNACLPLSAESRLPTCLYTKTKTYKTTIFL